MQSSHVGLGGFWRFRSLPVVSSSGFLLLSMLLFLFDVEAHGHGHAITDRIGESCSTNDIALYQGASSPLPSGIPTYTVQILNVCISGCTVSDVHVSCGWFSSARMINPRIFRRISHDDCLVNDGGPLGPGGSLSFEYANTFRYPLSVTYLRCH